jgi:hypothetical protein
MVKRRLDGQAREDWRRVCDTLGKRPGYTLYLVRSQRQMDVRVGKKTLTIYIDNSVGEYRHNWSDVAIRLLGE